MAPDWRGVQPVTSTATISRTVWGNPIIGPVLTTGKPRVLMGWIHQDDTPEGLMKGQIYCTVSGDKLYVYDTSGNRSTIPGQVVFCGKANFTMVRMFHPHWAKAGPGNTIPRDMAWLPNHEDKARLRQLYHKFLHDHGGSDEDGEPLYPMPALVGSTAVVDDANDSSSLFIPQNAGNASTSKTVPKKPGLPKLPKLPMVPTQRAPRVSKKKNKRSSPPSTNIAGMSIFEKCRFAAQDDGQSVKSEFRGTSLLSLTTPTTRNSPGTIFNPIDLIDFADFAAAVEEQARAYPANDESSTSQEPINLVDDYAQDLEDERLLAEWNARMGMQAQGSPGQHDCVPASPTLSNGGVEESIEVDEQDAQAQEKGSQETVLRVDDSELQMITEEDDKDRVGLKIVAEGGEGSSMAKPIVLD